MTGALVQRLSRTTLNPGEATGCGEGEPDEDAAKSS